ncbi:MAG: 2-polyprenyl-3-methyl-5-hydroxy-6-metoxy-1,4-benzoquinol methylase [Hyphomicrobiaceae bacterium]|jgi:2-polyprenyl-3-methyl-5-hydroxy-6-metoxy-1,4-benzoquinol methylase
MSSAASLKDLHCDICGGHDVALYHARAGRNVVRCSSCRMVFVDPMPSSEEKGEIEKRAYETDLLPEVADFFRNCHRDFVDDPVIEGFRHGLRWMGEHRPPGRLLDVGPGTGIFLFLARRDFGWEPYGVDICTASAVKAAAEFDIELDTGDFLTHDYPSGSFDAIAMLDMLEHTVEPSATLKRASELLAPGGVLYVAVPNQRSLMTVILDRWIRLGLPGAHFFLDRLYVEPHVYYFNPQALRLAMVRAGLEPIGISGGNVHLGRYQLPLWMRIPMEIVLKLGAMVGMSAKVLALARKPTS